MSTIAKDLPRTGTAARMSTFERYLTVWVLLCIVAASPWARCPDVFQAIGHMRVAHVNLPVGLLIWVMIIPMLVKVDLARCTRSGSMCAASASRCS